MSSPAIEPGKDDMKVSNDEEANKEDNKEVKPESKREVAKYSLEWFGFDIDEDGNQAPKLA